MQPQKIRTPVYSLPASWDEFVGLQKRNNLSKKGRPKIGTGRTKWTLEVRALLEFLRCRVGLSQREIANIYGVTQSTYNKWLSGARGTMSVHEMLNALLLGSILLAEWKCENEKIVILDPIQIISKIIIGKHVGGELRIPGHADHRFRVKAITGSA
jgi:DNA-binding transcriptional regulator YiaG